MQIPMPLPWLIGVTTTISLLLVFIVLLISATPAATWLYCKMRKQPIVAMAMDTGEMKFLPAKYKGGMAHTKNYGPVIMRPDAKYYNNGVPVGVAYERTASALPKDTVIAANILDSLDVQPEMVFDSNGKWKTSTPGQIADNVKQDMGMDEVDEQ